MDNIYVKNSILPTLNLLQKIARIY
jgi:hypothetical protein